MCRPPAIHGPVRQIKVPGLTIDTGIYSSNGTNHTGINTSPIVSSTESPILSSKGSPSASDGESKSPKRPVCPEFLKKLVDMLVDQSNNHIIEWKNNKIHVYDPHAVCNEVLPKYFRHSKYSSFQRQLNYFGFKKTEGKGKMTPCVYASAELLGKGVEGILEMKRKTNVMAPRKEQKHHATFANTAMSDPFSTLTSQNGMGPFQGPPYMYQNPLIKNEIEENQNFRLKEPLFPMKMEFMGPHTPHPSIDVPRTSLNPFELKFVDMSPPTSHLKDASSSMFRNSAVPQREFETKIDNIPPPVTDPLEFGVGSSMLDALINEWVSTSNDTINEFESQNSDSTTDDEEVLWENEDNFIQDVALAFL